MAPTLGTTTRRDFTVRIGGLGKSAWRLLVAVGVVLLMLWSSLTPASAASASLSASRDITWPYQGVTARMRSSISMTVVDNGAYGYFTGNIMGRTFNFTNRQICTYGRIVLRATITTPTTLRPELNNGWSLYDVRVVSARTNDFYYSNRICRTNSTGAGFGYSSSNPLRWSSSPWRVSGVTVYTQTYNLYGNGTVYKQVSSSDASAV